PPAEMLSVPPELTPVPEFEPPLIRPPESTFMMPPAEIWLLLISVPAMLRTPPAEIPMLLAIAPAETFSVPNRPVPLPLVPVRMPPESRVPTAPASMRRLLSTLPDDWTSIAPPLETCTLATVPPDCTVMTPTSLLPKELLPVRAPPDATMTLPPE